MILTIVLVQYSPLITQYEKLSKSGNKFKKGS
jgi:hypothetical protein